MHITASDDNYIKIYNLKKKNWFASNDLAFVVQFFVTKDNNFSCHKFQLSKIWKRKKKLTN